MSDYTDKELISKKDLLARYGISYGALYRWKRKGLIPEEWFIKRATVTGQETFFPAELMCRRMELILSQKEDTLLDELARRLSEEEKSNAVLVLHTTFGDRSVRVEDLRSVSLEGNGLQADMTAAIMELIAAHEKKQP